MSELRQIVYSPSPTHRPVRGMLYRVFLSENPQQQLPIIAEDHDEIWYAIDHDHPLDRTMYGACSRFVYGARP